MPSSTPETDPVLRVQTQLWLAIATAPPLLAVVALLASDRDPDLPLALPVGLLAAMSIAMLVAIVAVERLLVASPPGSDGAALAAYRTRFLLQAAISAVPALLGLAMSLALGPPWLGVLGAIGSLACALAFRPSRARLARLDRAWQAQGHDVSILRLLDRTAT